MSNYDDFRPSGSGGGTVSWSIKTADYTAVEGDYLQVDTSSNPITITLPASPVVNSIVCISDYKGNSSNNSITISNNGKNILGKENNDILINTNFATLKLLFVDDTNGWVLI